MKLSNGDFLEINEARSIVLEKFPKAITRKHWDGKTIYRVMSSRSGAASDLSVGGAPSLLGAWRVAAEGPFIRRG